MIFHEKKNMDVLPTELFEKIFLFLPYDDYRCWSLLSKRHNAVRVAHHKRLEKQIEKMPVSQIRRIPRRLLDKFVQTPKLAFINNYVKGELYDALGALGMLCYPYGPLRGPMVYGVVRETDEFYDAYNVYRDDIRLWFLEQFELKTVDYVQQLKAILDKSLCDEIEDYVVESMDEKNDNETEFQNCNQDLQRFFGFQIRFRDYMYLEFSDSVISYEVLSDSLNAKFDRRYPDFDEDSEWAEGDFQEPLVLGAEDVVRRFNFV